MAKPGRFGGFTQKRKNFPRIGVYGGRPVAHPALRSALVWWRNVVRSLMLVTAGFLPVLTGGFVAPYARWRES